MTGDTISIQTWSWYTGAVQPAATGVSDISTELLPLLTAGVAGVGGGKGGAIPSSTSDPIQGWMGQLYKEAKEQFFMGSESYITPGTNEYEAKTYQDNFHY
jgi:hypothetical protein